MLLFLTHQFLWAAMHQGSRKVGLGYEAEIESHRPPRDRQEKRAAAAGKKRL